MTFRAAAAEDEPFLFELFVSARRPQFAALGLPKEQLEPLLRMQHRAQTLGHRAQWPKAEDHIVLREGARVGHMRVDRSGPEWALIDFAVLEPGKGTGAIALAQLCADADAAGVPLQLQVARDNPAQRLYLRAGFVECGGDAVYLQLRRAPRAAPAKDDQARSGPTRALFERLVRETFEVAAPGGAGGVRLELVSVEPLPLARNPESFRLSFRGPRATALAQGVFLFEHPQLSREAIFIVPVATEGAGTLYEAVFNRG